MQRPAGRLNIAVIGGGISGISASYLLSRRHQVTLFEKRDYVGGHTCTVSIPDGPDHGMPVDVGFIVFNDRNYPNFTKFLGLLNVESDKSDMSFSYYDVGSGLEYAGTGLNGIFARRANILDPRFWWTVRGTIRFLRAMRGRLLAKDLAGITLGRFAEQEKIAPSVMRDFVVPMAAAIWSTPRRKILEFPAEAFAMFYENHGMLTYRNQPTWYYVKGGSRTYVCKFLEVFPGAVRTGVPVDRVRRNGQAVEVITAGGKEYFDAVVLAAHANQSLAMLDDPSPEETRLLGAWSYTANRVVLHTDPAQMPPHRRAWASWNYVQHVETGEDDPASLSYHMNRLQRLPTTTDYFVTLNSPAPFAKGSVIREFDFDHPTYSFQAMSTQEELRRLNGTRRTYYAGAHLYSGFHEDGCRSGVDVAAQFDCQL